MKSVSKYLLLALGFVFSQNLLAQTVNPFYEDGNIYIKVKTSAMASVGDVKNEIRHIPFLQDFANTYTVTEFRQLYAFAKHPGLENIYKISIAESNLIDQSIHLLSKLEALEYAEKVPYKKYFATPPNDTSYNNTLQWNLFKINAQVAWNFIGNPNPSQSTIAIIDDGLDINHIDLKDNLWKNDAEMNGLPGVDDDGNFIVDDSLGYDFGNFDTDPSPNDILWLHGTHVSGIAGAVTNNVTGIASIGYNARLMAVKGSNSNLYVSNGYEAIAYAADNGADVINLSWGAPVESITEANTIAYAHFLGAVIVAAAGNSNDATINFPAAYDHVINVSSTTTNDTKSIGTTYGQSIDVCAPGTNIFSTITGNGFGILSGTSMASPLVAGLAALMKTYNPLLTPDQVEACIKNNTDNIEFMNPNYTGKLGTGRINAFKAMQCVSATRHQIDASLKSFQTPDAFSCVSIFVPKVALKNCGTTNLQSVTINYQLDAGPFNTIQWTGDMAYDSLQFIELPGIAAATGQHTLFAYCTNPNGVLDWSFANDSVFTTFQIYNAGLSLPFIEDFENGFEDKAWRISNPDAAKTWEIKSGILDSVPNKAAFINLFNYSEKGHRDGLITPPLNFSGYDSLKLQFDYAWKRNFRQKSDTLIIYASTDCGESFPHRIAKFYQDSLIMFATNSDTMDYYFNPTLSSSWCGNIIDCIDLDLTSLAGNSSVLLKFETYNNFNNNLFIDNINVSGTSLASSAPTGNLIAASANAICVGEIVNFTATDPNNNATEWNWTFSAGTPSTVSGQNVSVLFNTPGTVTASVVISNSIGSSTFNLANPVVVNALPLVNIIQPDTVICADNSIVLNVNGANTYHWSPNLGLSDTTGGTVTALPHQPITYYVIGTSSAGCVNVDSISIDTTICLGLAGQSLSSGIRVYYQVSNAYLMISNGDLELKNNVVTLYNALGQNIYQSDLNIPSKTNKAMIDCGALSEGIYFVVITAQGKKVLTEKVLIHKQ